MIREITDQRPSNGYRRVHNHLNRGLKEIGLEKVNAKRVYRIMKDNDLLLQRFGPRPLRVHDGKIITLASNMRWCSDGFRIQCWNGEHLEVAFSLDCHDREVMSYVTSSRGIDGELVRDLMAESVEQRFGKDVRKLPKRIQWLTDNGPGFVANETVYFGRSLGFEMCSTAPYSPESNGMAEAFVKTFKRDYVNLGDLSSAERVREQLPIWFEDYNEKHPHSGLKMKSPREYRREKKIS
jgi:transposase InsO family protein